MSIKLQDLLRREERLGGIDRRQFDRIKLTQGQYVVLDAEVPKLGPLQIDNISSSGIAFSRIGITEIPAQGSTIKGSLISTSTHIPITLKVIRISDDLIACEFEDQEDNLTKFIVHQYEIEIAGLKLCRIRPEIITSHRDGKPWWHRSSNGKSEFFLLEKHGCLARFYLFTDEVYIEGANFGDLRYSFVSYEVLQGKPDKKSVLRFVSSPVPSEILELGVKFIQTIDSLPARYKESILQILTTGRST